MVRRTVVLVVAGDAGSGKTSLISAACHEQYSEAPPAVLPTARFPAELFNSPEEVSELLVVDTSSREEDARQLEASLRAAAAVVVCVDPRRKGALGRLRRKWLPEAARLAPGAPVVVAVCKDDGAGGRADLGELREAMESLIAAYPNLEVSIRCSAKEMQSVGEVFYHALKAVLYPKAPLLDPATGRLTTPCVKALLRIFLMCDADQDGALSDDELNAFQVLCFGQPLSDEELDAVKSMVAERMPEGISDAGLMFPGFMYLHTLFLTRGRLESTWTVLKAFGYNHELRIADSAFAHLPQTGPDTVLELSATALTYLAHTFDVYDSTRTGVLNADDMEHMFNRAPVPIYQLDLWNRTLVAGAGLGLGPLTKEGYLTRWRAFALQEPRLALEQMMYLGLGGRTGEGAGELLEPRPRRRKGERRPDLSSRTTLHCAVFGGLASGKSSFVKALAGRPPGEALAGMLSAAASVAVGRVLGSKEVLDVKTLVLTEVTSAAEASDPMTDLSRLDVAAVVYDSSDAASFASARALAEGVSTLAGEGLPVVLVAAKDDVGASPELREQVAAACRELAISAPLQVSVAQDNLGQPNAYRCLAEAALMPEGHIPDTAARKLRRRNARRAWIGAGAVVATAAAGYAAYRLYKASPGGGGGSGGASSSGGGGGGGSGVDGGALVRGLATLHAAGAAAAAGVAALGASR